MKRDRILNPELISAIASLGHTEYMVIGDAGLPIPDGITIIDLSVVKGIPAFMDVLRAVAEELVIQSFIYASEMNSVNPALAEEVKKALPGIPNATVTHEEFKNHTGKAKIIVRTGECSSFANIILVGGVNF
jgi:D-ribose pyranase